MHVTTNTLLKERDALLVTPKTIDNVKNPGKEHKKATKDKLLVELKSVKNTKKRIKWKEIFDMVATEHQEKLRLMSRKM